MTIRFVSSVTLAKSYLPSHQAGSESSDGDSGCSLAPVGVSVGNIALQSALEIEATWPRPEELGAGPVGKAQYRERALRCQLHYVPLQCHVK